LVLGPETRLKVAALGVAGRGLRIPYLHIQNYRPDKKMKKKLSFKAGTGRISKAAYNIRGQWDGYL
jgi:hypothetical protein